MSKDPDPNKHDLWLRMDMHEAMELRCVNCGKHDWFIGLAGGVIEFECRNCERAWRLNVPVDRVR